MKKQHGFTLIELVMVIVILGILAATALPKFASLQGNARYASLKGALGSVKAAAGISHAASLVANSNTVTIEGKAYTLTNGYPSASAASVRGGVKDFAELAGLSGGDYTIASGKVTLGTCNFTYTDATTTAPPIISAITGDTNGVC